MSDVLNKSCVTDVNHDNFVKVVERAYETKLSLFVQGKIGVGKSTSVRKAAMNKAKQYGMGFVETKNPNQHPDKFCLVDLRLAQKDAGEILGLPETYALVKRPNLLYKATKDNKEPEIIIENIPLKILTSIMEKKEYANAEIETYVTKWSMPSWYPISGRGIIFVDEFNLAPPLVQYSMYELINDRCLGDYKLPDGWAVIGAGNRGTVDGAPVFDFPSPLNNRFMWYELGLPKVDQWTEWALNNGVDYRVIAFINTKNSALYNFDSKKKEKAFATPRSWSKVSDMIRGVEDEDDICLYVSGVVGTFLAGEFAAFMKARRSLPSTDKYIKNAKDIELPKTGDLTYTMACNLVEYLLASKTGKDKNEPIEILKAITIIATRLWKEQKQMEYAVFLLKLVKTTDEVFFRHNIILLQEFTEISGIIKKYLIT
jgi:hypothetical protein